MGKNEDSGSPEKYVTKGQNGEPILHNISKSEFLDMANQALEVYGGKEGIKEIVGLVKQSEGVDSLEELARFIVECGGIDSLREKLDEYGLLLKTSLKVAGYEADIVLLTSELREAKSKAASGDPSAQAECDRLQGLYDTAQKDLARVQGDFNNYKEGADKKITSLEEARREAVENAGKEKERADGLGRRVSEEEGKSQRAEANLATKTREYEGLEAVKSRLEGEVDSKKKELGKLQEQYETAQTNLANLQGEFIGYKTEKAKELLKAEEAKQQAEQNAADLEEKIKGYETAKPEDEGKEVGKLRKDYTSFKRKASCQSPYFRPGRYSMSFPTV